VTAVEPTAVELAAGEVTLDGFLGVPDGAAGVVVFAHGSGSGRHSPRNTAVAEPLRRAGLATLLFDLLTPGEEAADLRTRELRFDIPLLAGRLSAATDWLRREPATASLAPAYFGASTGAAAALIAAADRADVASVVSRGGRPDLAGEALDRVTAPALLIVGGNDPQVLDLNAQAVQRLQGRARLEIVPGATHLFEERGALESVTDLATDFLVDELTDGGDDDPIDRR
jgi:dienelactone hydrolase